MVQIKYWNRLSSWLTQSERQGELKPSEQNTFQINCIHNVFLWFFFHCVTMSLAQFFLCRFLYLPYFHFCFLLSSSKKGCLAHTSSDRLLEIMHHGRFSRIFLFPPSREKNKRIRMAWEIGSEHCFTGICSCFWIAEVTGGKQYAQRMKEMVWLQYVPNLLGRNFLIVTEVLLNNDSASLYIECVRGSMGNSHMTGAKKAKVKKITDLWPGRKPFCGLWPRCVAHERFIIYF